MLGIKSPVYSLLEHHLLIDIRIKKLQNSMTGFTLYGNVLITSIHSVFIISEVGDLRENSNVAAELS